jgi:nucleotide-binding universal stress UspA family protein
MSQRKQGFSLHSMTKTKTPHTSRRRSVSAHEGSDTPGSASVFANILCAVDGTWTSTAAVEMAASLAGPDGHLTLLAVTAVSGSGAYTAAAISPGRVDLVLSNAKRIADDAGVPSSTVVDPGGPPVEVILKRASDHDLLAIGAPATSWLGGMLTGGVATTALSQFTAPILFAHRSFTGSLRGRQILVASDGEEGSDHIVDLAGRLGQSEGAQVTLVNALGAESKMNPRAIKAQARALQLALPNAGEPRIEPGNARDVILDAAKHTKAALVVIGSRRLHGLHAFGSVSRRVVHDAHCSVLVIPPGQ